jgi:hypothetical protein
LANLANILDQKEMAALILAHSFIAKFLNLFCKWLNLERQ